MVSTRPITAEELRLAAAALTRGYARNFETADQIARAATQLALYDLPDTYFAEFVPRIERLTTERGDERDGAPPPRVAPDDGHRRRLRRGRRRPRQPRPRRARGPPARHVLNDRIWSSGHLVIWSLIGKLKSDQSMTR